MLTAHKIRLNPTPEQADYFRRAAGTRRFVYNWGLDHWQTQYAAYQADKAKPAATQQHLKLPTAMALKQEFNALRDKDYPWTYDVTKCVVEGAFFDLRDAFERFFSGQNAYPQFKQKGKSRESFYIANDKFTMGKRWVVIPVLGRFILTQREANGTQTQKIRDRDAYKRTLGKVNLAESLRFVVGREEDVQGKRRQRRKTVWCRGVKILGATVGLEGSHWYLSLQLDIQKEVPVNTGPVLGMDVGLKESAVVSDGRRFENQKPLTTHLRRLRGLARAFSRKQYDPETKTSSHNRLKARDKLIRLYDQMKHIRLDAQHKLTTKIARSCSVVGIEDLHVKGMFKNRTLARAMADAGLGQLLRMLATKMVSAGGRAILVSRFFPSTKTCSGCGHVKKRMPLKYRTYICLKCGLQIDRDLNAAINLEREAQRILAQEQGSAASVFGIGSDETQKTPADKGKTNQES